MRRRELITLLGGATAAWPLAARAQQAERMRRMGVLMNVGEASAVGERALALFKQALERLGWSDGRNIQLTVRWAAGDPALFRKHAVELVGLEPDVLFAVSTPAVTPLRNASRTVPIVFIAVIDPVGSGLVRSLARPSGNATGFVTFEYALAAKWLELLKEVAPRLARAAVLRDPTIAAGIGQFAAIQAVGAVGMELSAIDLRDAAEVEQAIADFAGGSNGGLVVTASPFGATHPEIITALAAKYNLPAVYPYRYFVSQGGLMSYGPDLLDEYPRAASYVDRILRGEKPADLPVQAPTKYELVMNIKTARSLGLEVPPTLLARADEVIE
jgi:putative ABC transport system substrate-binding protein